MKKTLITALLLASLLSPAASHRAQAAEFAAIDLQHVSSPVPQSVVELAIFAGIALLGLVGAFS